MKTLNYACDLRGVTKLVVILDKGKCHICQKQVKRVDTVLDHIIPHAITGREEYGKASDEYWNLALAHRNCNVLRSDGKTPGQLRLPLPISISDIRPGLCDGRIKRIQELEQRVTLLEAELAKSSVSV